MKQSKQNNIECASDSQCNEEGFVCKDCSSQYDFQDMNSNISQQKQKRSENDNEKEEEKEEETECYYCIKSGQQACNEAALLYKGKACCLQCKQSNIVNYIAAPDGKQRTIVIRRQESQHYVNTIPTSMQPNQQDYTHRQLGGYQQPFSNSTKNMTNPQGGFFPSQKQGIHQKHQSEMLPNKNESADKNGNIGNNNNYIIQGLEEGIKIEHSESVSLQKANLNNNEQDKERISSDNTPKHQKNSQTDPFAGRNIMQNKDLMASSNMVDLTNSYQSNFTPLPTSPQILIKDVKIECILKEIIKRGQSFIQKKAVLSLMENRKDFTSQKYHDKLDKKKQILYIVILKSGFMFGGFHYATLKSQKERSIDDMHSGIFSMQGSDINFYPVENNKIIYFDNGVWFGKPPCLIINFDMIDKCFCNKEFIFLTPQGHSQTLTFGPTTKWNQIIQDICVLQF